MQIDLVWQISVILGLVGFGVWFSYLTFRLGAVLGDVDNRGQDIDEIRESVEIVAAILERLPEMMPQFQMNQSPLQPVIEWFMQQRMNSGDLLESPIQNRDEAGKYASAEEKQN